MDLARSEAVKLVRKWEWQRRKITCLIVFPGSDTSIALNGRVSVREGGIMLRGYGGCEFTVTHVESVTFQYCNGCLVVNGVGWWCGLWEPED